MTIVNRVSRPWVLAVALVGVGQPAMAQQSIMLASARNDVVRNAPYSGDGTTTTTRVLGDGTHIERTTTAKVFRDSAGRERREQTIVGLAALTPLSESAAIVTIVDPVAGTAYTLDPKTRTARQMRLPAISMPEMTFSTSGQVTVRVTMRSVEGVSGTPASGPPPPPPGGTIPARLGLGPGRTLGTRQIEGVSATGTMTTTTIPAGQIGNDRPMAVTDEQWMSPDLRVLVRSHHHDPRTGDVEYQLTNILRVEPSPDLFTVPPDYTVVALPPPPPPPPGN